jgi:hypothetical protein
MKKGSQYKELAGMRKGERGIVLKSFNEEYMDR